MATAAMPTPASRFLRSPADGQPGSRPQPNAVATGPERSPRPVSSQDFPQIASVVVIGGGVMGLSAAYHLARSGVRDVVVIEQGELGSGSTCKAAGGVRAQFSDAVNIELGLRSLRAFERFRQDFDQEIDLHQVGYLFLLDRPEHVDAFERNV